MGNCLVTKLKGVVDNPSLLKIDESLIEFKVGTSSLNMYFNDGITGYSARVVSGTGHFSDGAGADHGTEYTTTTSNSIVFVAVTDCVVAVNVRYRSKVGLLGSNGNRPIIDGLGFSFNNTGANYVDFYGIGLKGDLSRLKANRAIGANGNEVLIDKDATGVTEFIINSMNIGRENSRSIRLITNASQYSDINPSARVDLVAFDGISNTNVPGINGCYGDIKYLAGTNTPDFWIPFTWREGLTGSIEDFVQKAIGYGKTTGRFRFAYARAGNAQITYQGTLLQNNTDIPNIENTYFDWDAQGNITWNS